MPSAIQKIGVEEVEDAIRKGLRQGNPNMVRVVEEMRERDTALDILKNIEIEITPYTVPDDTLYNIVLRAPDYVIDEIQNALRERRRLAEFGGEELGDA